MANVPGDINQGIRLQGNPCAFPLFGNVGTPLMATLNIPGFTMILSVWLLYTPNVLNALYASQASTLCQEHQTHLDPLLSSQVNLFLLLLSLIW